MKIRADLSPISEFMEFCEGLAEFFEDIRTRNAITSRATQSAKNAFNLYVDRYASGHEEELGHMYEWGEVGRAEGRLWHVLIKPPNRGTTVVTYDFLRSKVEVPVGPEVSGVADDTRTGGHIFYEKAEITEKGIMVTISPVNGDYLAIPNPEQGEMFFTRNTVYQRPSAKMVGAFERLWVEQFTILAHATVAEDVVQSANKFLNREAEMLPGTLSKSRAAQGTRVKPKKNTKAIAKAHGEQWVETLNVGTNIERGLEG
jgi:hypothetical protein